MPAVPTTARRTLTGVELEVVPATRSTLIPGLKAKQRDAVFANLFVMRQPANGSQPGLTALVCLAVSR